MKSLVGSTIQTEYLNRTRHNFNHGQGKSLSEYITGLCSANLKVKAIGLPSVPLFVKCKAGGEIMQIEMKNDIFKLITHLHESQRLLKYKITSIL